MAFKNIIVLGVFFYNCWKWFTYLFNSHDDPLQCKTVICWT